MPNSISFYSGGYSFVKAKILVGDLLLTVFALLVGVILDKNQQGRFGEPTEDRWAETPNSEGQGTKSKKTDEIDLDAMEDESWKYRTSGFGNLVFQHSFAMAVALGTPHHSPLMIALGGFHLASLLVYFVLVFRSVKLAWIPWLLCLLTNIVIYVLCLVEKMAQIELSKLVGNLAQD